jgi:hypothetical protein
MVVTSMFFVIAGPDPAIQLLLKRMDARVEPRHDEWDEFRPEC